MPLSPSDLDDSTKNGFDKARAYTVAVSNPSDPMFEPTIARARTVPSTSSDLKPKAPETETLKQKFIRQEALKEKMERERKKPPPRPESGEKGEKSENCETSENANSELPATDTQSKPRQAQAHTHTHTEHEERGSDSDTVIMHTLNEILPLSKFSESNSKQSLPQNRSPPNSKFKEWVPDAESAPFRLHKVNGRLWLWAFVAVVLVLVCCLIPSVFFAIRGSRLALWNYLASLRIADQRKMVNSMAASVYGVGEVENSAAGVGNFTAGSLFDGVVYSPKNTMEPVCGYSAQDALLDVATLASVTSKLRTYGTQCSQVDHLVHAIQKLGLNMTLMMGVWIGNDSAANTAQIDSAKVLLSKYPSELFDSVMVGNEALYRGDVSESRLVEYVDEMRQYTSTKGIRVAIGTADIVLFVTPRVLASVDVVGVNVLPFFTGLPVEEAAQWTADYVISEVVAKKGNASVSITEVGWPYSGGTYYDSVATPENYQKFLNTWRCNTSLSGVDSWYYFEAFDEPWKSVFHSDENRWETEWGVFGPHRNMKPGIEFGTC